VKDSVNSKALSALLHIRGLVKCEVFIAMNIKTGKGKGHSVTGLEGTGGGGERGIAVPTYNFGPGVSWVVKATPRTIYLDKSRTTHFIGS